MYPPLLPQLTPNTRYGNPLPTPCFSPFFTTYILYFPLRPLSYPPPSNQDGTAKCQIFKTFLIFTEPPRQCYALFRVVSLGNTPPPLPRRRSISQCYLGEKYEKGEEKKEENVRKKGKRKKKKGKLKLKG